MEQAWTIRRVLAWTAKDFEERGIESARLDAELLVARALGLSRVALYMDLDRPLDDEERVAIRALVKRRRLREPIAYILGEKEFWGRRFTVSPAVLIPRPDTEALIERALELLPEGSPSRSQEGAAPGAGDSIAIPARDPHPSPPPRAGEGAASGTEVFEAESPGRALDLCTGSGIIGVTLAAERPGLCVDLTDLSPDALALARANAEANGVADRVRLLEGDLFAPLEPDARYALIASNPPYIPDAEVATLAPDVRDHEPRLALAGGADGLALVRRIATEAGAFLLPGGALLLEVGAGQAPIVEALLAQQGWVEATARHRDLGGIERVVEARRR